MPQPHEGPAPLPNTGTNAGHPPLYDGERPLEAYGPEVLEAYRVTWRPSFNATVTVRVAKRTDGFFAYIDAPDAIRPQAFPVSPAVRRLTAQEWDSIFSPPWDGFWENPPARVIGGLDGTSWRLEGYQKGRGSQTIDWWERENRTAYRWALSVVQVAPGHIAPGALF